MSFPVLFYVRLAAVIFMIMIMGCNTNADNIPTATMCSCMANGVHTVQLKINGTDPVPLSLVVVVESQANILLLLLLLLRCPLLLLMVVPCRLLQ